MSRCEACLRVGKLEAACTERVKTSRRPANTAAVPSPCVHGNLCLAAPRCCWQGSKERTPPPTHLVNVQIQDENALNAFLCQQHFGRHREIVQDAISRAVIWKGVVCAARCVAGQAMLQCQSGSEERAWGARAWVGQQRARGRAGH